MNGRSRGLHPDPVFAPGAAPEQDPAGRRSRQPPRKDSCRAEPLPNVYDR
jgi:hypothetical protein